jgi:DNA polymerase-1
MIAVDRWLQDDTPPVRMVMQVHDELVFEVQAEAVDSARPLITRFMQQAARLSVPLVVDVGMGDDWDQAH